MKKKSLVLFVAAAMTLLISAGSAFARDRSDCKKKRRESVECTRPQAEPGTKPQAKPGTGPQAVPEIDAASGSPAIALVLGVALLGAERLRRRSKHRAE